MPHRHTTLFALLILSLSLLAGCVEPVNEPVEPAGADEARGFDTSKGWSEPLTPRRYDVLPGVQVEVPSFDGTELAVGVFLPDVPGCDWNASELPERCHLPTVMEGSPYWLDGVDVESHRPPKADWFGTRGYAIVQMSLRGTGESDGCYRFKDPRDVEDISSVIDWVAEQPWSNGNVGMIGRSYDGTAAWAGAASGNPHLKTIVPISGAVDGPHLYYKNGTSEARGFFQPTFYYLYAYGLAAGDPTYRTGDWATTACPGAGEDWVRGPKAALTGDASSPYWQSRDLTDDIVANYTGSAWVIHGMQDWNVNPSQAVPFTREMREAGIPTRAWLGQWDHAYPDRVDEHRNVRWDWAQQLLTWFDHHLKEEGPEPWMGVEVEDHLYVWRKEAQYPPADKSLHPLELGAGGGLAPGGEAEPGAVTIAPEQPVTFTSAPLEDDLRVVGLPQLHVTATPTTPRGGYVFAELYDVWPDGTSMRIGWAAMNLRYHEGGNTEEATLTPGEPVLAKMQFEPMDAHVAQGHVLKLVLHKDGVADIVESPSKEPVQVRLGDGASTLRLFTVDRPGVGGARAPASIGDVG